MPCHNTLCKCIFIQGQLYLSLSAPLVGEILELMRTTRQNPYLRPLLSSRHLWYMIMLPTPATLVSVSAPPVGKILGLVRTPAPSQHPS